MAELKVLLLGLDGATLRVMKPLMAESKLPTLSRVAQNGFSGPLTSTIPTLSPPAWCSIFTGKNPGKHGVYDFDYRVINSYNTRPHSSQSIRGKALWDLVSLAGKKIVVVNAPFTYPPYEINGTMISGFPSPDNHPVSYPADVASHLQEMFSYEIDVSTLKPDYQGIDEDAFIDEVYALTKHRTDAICYLLRESWDCFIAVFTDLDRIQHVFWGYMDSKHPASSLKKAVKYKETIMDYYKMLDEQVARVFEHLEEDVVKFVVSDHGFEPLYKSVGINNWLSQSGFLTQLGTSSRFGLRQEALYNSIHRLGLGKLIEMIPQGLRDKVPMGIAYGKTTAFCAGFANIYINLKDREQHGIVSHDERMALLDRLIESLRTLTDPENGEKIVEHAYLRNEMYSGKYQDEAGDLILVLKEGYEPKMWNKSGVVIESTLSQIGESKSTKTGMHQGISSSEGILFVEGPYIKKNVSFKASVYDLTPTILHILDVAVPSDADGKVLKELFEAESPLVNRQVRYASTWQSSEKDVYDDRDAAEIERRLRALGYM